MACNDDTKLCNDIVPAAPGGRHAFFINKPTFNDPTQKIEYTKTE